MSVVWAREHWEGRDGSFESTTKNTLTRTWKVKTNDKYDNQFVVINHFASSLGIVYGATHPSNGFFTARILDVKQDAASPIAWRVTVTYSTEPINEDEDQPPNPLDRPLRISGDSEMAQIFTTKDKDGKAMVNSAGDPLEPYEKDDPRGIIIITKNFPDIPTFVSNYINKVNDSEFSIPGIPFPFPARTTKFQRFRFSDKQVQNGVTFVEITVELSVIPATWDADRLDEGFHNRVLGIREKIVFEDGSEPTEPVPLDGEGVPLPDPTTDNVVYLPYRVYEEADFSVLFS